MHAHLSPFRRCKDRHAVAVFDNPGAFAGELSSLSGYAGQAREMQTESPFYSCETWDAAARGVVEGDAATAARAAALTKKIQAVSYATPKRQRIASPYGRVSVGAYLASDPMPCRRKVKAPSDHAPLSIVVSLNSIGGVDSADLERRGVAIAALVKRIVAERPVTLYLSRFSVVGGLSTCALVKFPTAPLDSHRLAYLLTSQGFARGMGFAFHRSAHEIFRAAGDHSAKDVSASFGVAFAGGAGYSQKRKCPFSADLSEFLGQPVLYIPGSDPSLPEFKHMVKNPVDWINATVAELTANAATPA